MNRPLKSGIPLPVFSIATTVAVIVGIVVGIGIFRLPPLVAQAVGSPLVFMLVWLLGGIISLLGALCYVELATARPNAGGEYFFLRESYGAPLGFLFAWARMTVIQTGSLALVAYILGEHANQLLYLGPQGTVFYALLAIVSLTAVNLWGSQPTRQLQNSVAAMAVLALLGLGLYGLWQGSESPVAVQHPSSLVDAIGTPGLAMIFVLLSFGGWNEAAYLSAEIRHSRRGMLWILLSAIALITGLYLLINAAYLQVLGFEGLREADAVGIRLAEVLLGDRAAIVMALVVVVAALSTANATIITGARANYALGRDYRKLRWLGFWHPDRNAPTHALLLQAALALLLVLLGAYSQQAVSSLVEYTAPVFWLFILLVTLSLFIFRRREGPPANAATPLYPLSPLVFAAVCLYMLYSSLMFTGTGALMGVCVLLAGIPVYWWVNKTGYTSELPGEN